MAIPMATAGEFAEIEAPRTLVMTRWFEKHPLARHDRLSLAERALTGYLNGR